VDAGTSVAKSQSQTSYSWWILFICVRQVITFSLGRAAQYLFVMHCQGVDQFWFGFGPLVRLFVLQARGIPLQLVAWSLINFAMLYGNGQFARHWLFYQDTIGLFNASNPSGPITGDPRYRGAIVFALCCGLVVAAKRFCVGLHFGKKTYMRYAERLSVVLKMVVDVTHVARLTEIAESTRSRESAASILDRNVGAIDSWLGKASDGQGDDEGSEEPDDSSNDRYGEENKKDSTSGEGNDREGAPPTQELLVDSNRGTSLMGDSQKVKIDQLLGEWEEPDLQDGSLLERPTLSSIVQFRASVSVLDSEYPFSPSFGQTNNRLQVIECCQQVYMGLLQMQRHKIRSSHSDSPVLKFHTIALAAKDPRNGTFKEAKIRELVKLFRPQRNGDITLLDFCKAVDGVYKEMRLIRASIANEGRMNAASERFLNIVFYFLLIFIGMAAVGVDPRVLFGFLLSFVVSISFAVGGACSDYMRGLLFVLVQKPYDIGDRINVASVESVSCTTGSPGWIVKDVSL
jgi:hypothetical protein